MKNKEIKKFSKDELNNKVNLLKKDLFNFGGNYFEYDLRN